MRTALLACLAAAVQTAGASSDVPPTRVFPEDHTLEARTEMSSEAFPAPKAPPPTEVTRAFATREEDAISPEALQQQLNANQAPVLWNEKNAMLLESAVLDHTKKRAISITSEKVVQLLCISLFVIALTCLSLLVVSEFKGRLPTGDALFPPSMQPQEVPSAIAELLTTRKVVVFLSDDCQVCMAGLKSLEREREKPVAVLLMGHRLGQAMRNYLEGHYGISRLPAIFVEGEFFPDFEGAVLRLAKGREGPSSSRSNNDNASLANGGV